MDCLVQPQGSFWTGVVPHGLPTYQRNYFPNFYFPGKGPFGSTFYPGPGLFFPHDDDVDYPTDMKGELNQSTMSYPGMTDENGDIKMCCVCGERASGFYFGALVCLPCKSFYIRCTKDGEPSFTCQCSGNCDIVKQGRIRCQYCRYQRCIIAGMCRKEKPETVQPAEGQVLCKVCGDIANGIHFGVNTCEGCKKFFRRGLVENQSYVCKGEKECGINPRNRNNCRYCRYQKCLGVGMSREAIKMGRPKKGDGNDACPPTSNSPKTPDQSLTDVDTITNAHMTSPSSGQLSLERDDTTIDTLKNTSGSEKTIKQENERPSCEYLRKMGEMSYQREQNMAQWQHRSQMNCNKPLQNGPTQSNVPEFIEEEMDEILMMLQNDNQNSGDFSAVKKMRCYDYNAAMRQKNCKSEFPGNSPQGQGQWHITELSRLQDNIGSPMNEPMNMSVSQMMPLTPRGPPPQYPGVGEPWRSGAYTQDHCTSGMQPSPCNSPMRQMHSPGSGYMSDSSVQSSGYMSAGSPGYGSNTSPNHSPACQYSPDHSPVYHSLSSPQPSPYQSDCGSPQGSPYNPEPMYQQQGSFHGNHGNQSFVQDLSVNVNMAAPISPPSQSSPTYIHNHNNNNHHHMTLQSNTNVTPMTIPNQEGGVTSHDSWCLTGSPLQTRPQTLPTQERGYGNNRHTASSWQENLQRINHYFTRQSYNRTELSLIADDEMEGAVTRNDIEREVVCKTLAATSPADPYFYVMTDHQSCSSDSSSNYEEFTSCRRINKRKNCDDSDVCNSTQSCDDFQVGRYKRQLTEKYWQSTGPVNEDLTMTADKQALMDHLLTNFKQMVNKYTDSIKPVGVQDGNNRQQIQLRIVKNTSSGVKFASQIPGFGNLHPDDKTFLCKNVTFMSTLLMAGHQLYNQAENNFRDFWNWTINPTNPFYPFKQTLIELGEKIHHTNLDMYEVAALSALLYMAADFTDLVYPEAIKEARKKIMVALQSYELAKGVDVKSRMSEMLSLVPGIRHAGMWHHELMKQMKVNTQIQEVHQLCELVQFRES